MERKPLKISPSNWKYQFIKINEVAEDSPQVRDTMKQTELVLEISTNNPIRNWKI